jgi:hypothetical protein
MMYAACAGTFFGGFVALAAASIILKRVIQRRAITIAVCVAILQASPPHGNAEPISLTMAAQII